MRFSFYPRSLVSGLISASFILSLSACGSGHVEELSEQKIYGGTKVPSGGWPSTVAITSFLGMHCSGTAITPKVVITAGHCVGASFGSTYVYVGEGAFLGLVKGQFKAKRIKASPLYGNDNEGMNDIGYILLEKPLNLPASAYIPVLVDEDEIGELLQVGAATKLVGFGNREDGGTGRKYEANAPITKVGLNEVSIGGDGIDSCQGDSGGPVYGRLKSGEWRVYGVTSRGGACGTGGIYGRMDANICWIQEDSGEDLGLPDGYCEKKAIR